MPVPLRKNARSSRAAIVLAASAAVFRLRLGGGVAAPTPFQPSLRLRSTVSARRPQTEAGFLSAPRHPVLFDLSLQQFACAAKLPNRPATRQCFARVQVPNAQQPNVMRPGQLKGVGNIAQMFKSAGEFYGRPTVELTNRRKRGTLGRFFNH
jgi:hypothetical protein